MPKNLLHQILNLPTKNLTILCHTKPDADTLGAALSLRSFFAERGKTISLVCKDSVPEHYQVLIQPYKYSAHLDDNPILAVDTGGIETTGFADLLTKHAAPIFCIDHHEPGRDFASHMYRDTKASSTCEIIYTLLNEFGAEISKTLADYLIAGILQDTDHFRHANTTKQTLNIAADLISRGARIPKATKSVSAKLPLATLRLWGRVLNRVRLHEKSKTVWAVIDEHDLAESGTPKENLELSKLMFIINSIDNTDFSLILSQTDSNLIKGSLRSDEKKNRPTDVSKIANHYGGGGHRFASGFSMPGKLVRDGDQWKIIK